MKKLLVFGLLMIVMVAVLLSLTRFSRHDQGLPSRLDKKTHDQEQGITSRKHGDQPHDIALDKPLYRADHEETDGSGKEEASPEFCSESGTTNYEDWLVTQQEFGRPEGLDRRDRDPFKEHLSHLFRVDQPIALEGGGSDTDCILGTHPQDIGYQQGTAVLPSLNQETTSEKKIKSPGEHLDQGIYTARGLSHMAEEPGERGESRKSAKNGRVGYRFSQALALEAGLDHIPGLPGHNLSPDFPSTSASDIASLDITSYTSALKVSPDLGSKTTRPYLVGGFGLMHAEPASDKYGPTLWFIDPNHEAELAMSGKIGLGVEFRKENTSIGIEANLDSGSGDLADVVYQTLNMGLTLHW